MSTHFSISLGLIIACSVHVFFILKLEINQEVMVFKKEKNLTIILNKIPEKPVEAIEMPVSATPIIEKIEKIAKIEQPQTPKKSTKKPKQKPKSKPPKKESVKNIETPKHKINVDEQLEIPPPNTNMVSEQPLFQETQPQETHNIIKKENKTKTISCNNCFFCPKPHYPFVAKQRGIEGRVKLALKIDENGTVVDAKILESEPEDMFEDAALEAVMQCQNIPEQLFNLTVEQTIKFELKP